MVYLNHSLVFISFSIYSELQLFVIIFRFSHHQPCPPLLPHTCTLHLLHSSFQRVCQVFIPLSIGLYCPKSSCISSLSCFRLYLPLTVHFLASSASFWPWSTKWMEMSCFSSVFDLFCAFFLFLWQPLFFSFVDCCSLFLSSQFFTSFS